MAKWKQHAAEPRKNPSEGIYTFKQLLEKMEQERPDIPCYSTMDYCTGKVTTVMPEKVRRQSEGLGTWFYENGKSKKIIGICSNNCYEWFLGFFGAQYAGSIVLLIDRTVEIDVLEDQIRRSGCKDILFSKDVADKMKAVAESTGIRMIPVEQLPELAEKGRRLIEEGCTECLNRTNHGDETAVIMYTSGVTGISKGVMLSAKNLLSNAECLRDVVNTNRSQVLVVPLNHVYAITSHILALMSRNCVHICINLRHMLDDFTAAKPQLLVLVPMMVQNLYSLLWKKIQAMGATEKVKQTIDRNRKQGNVSNEEKRSMFAPYLAIFGGRCEIIICGGAPLDPMLYEGFLDFGITVLEGYGITECSPALSMNPEGQNKPGTVGKVLPGHELMILNPDKNGIGEICARGPSIMSGYYCMEEETRKALDGGWFHTGDLGWIDEEKYLTITGRIKNLIILSNAENISAEALEEELSKCKAIAEVCVYEKDDRIAAMIYPDMEYIEREGIQDGKEWIKEYISEYNRTAVPTKKIRFVFFRNEPFERTESTKKIKRTFEKM